MPRRLRKATTAPTQLPPIVHGPWVGVRTVSDPGEEQANLLYDLTNGYLADPEHGSGTNQRPPFSNVTGPLGTVGNRVGQGVYTHTEAVGAVDRLVFCGGKVYVWNGSFPSGGLMTDITPTNVAIAKTGRIFCASLGDRVIVSDGVNPPWLLNLTGYTATVLNQGLAPVIVLFLGSPNTTLAVTSIGYPTGSGGASVATSASIALPASTIAANQWGSYRVSISTAGVFSVVAASATMSYASQALALAAAPAPTAFDVGTVVIQAAAGTFTAGTTALTAATQVIYGAPTVRQWSAVGSPVVYGAKVFFILGTQDGVGINNGIVWSEENQPSVGYQQLNYANYWQLTQTSADPLYALAATNAALYFFRRTKIGAITGAVSSTFRSTATLDAVSTTFGTNIPASVLIAENYIWFCTEDGKPHRFEIGSRAIQPCWLDLRDPIATALSTAGVKGSAQTCAIACYQPELRLVLFALWSPSVTVTDTAVTLYAFSAVSGQYQGTWTLAGGVGLDTLGVMQDGTGRSVVAGLGCTDASTTSQRDATRGYFYVQSRTGDQQTGQPWADSGGPIAIALTTGELVGDAQTDKLFDLVTVRLRASDATLVNTDRNIGISYTTPRIASGGNFVAPISRVLSGEDRKVVAGLNATGRWLKLTITGPSSGPLGTSGGFDFVTSGGLALTTNVPLMGPLAFEQVTVNAYTMGDDPDIL